MKINNSILVLGVLSISFLIVLNIIQSSTAQYPGNYYNNYNPYNDYYRYNHYHYDNRYGDNYYYDEYDDSDDYYYDKTFDFTVRLPW